MYVDDRSSFTIKNSSANYFYPDEDLREGLEELILFPEAQPNHKVPTGSVWKYKGNTPYNPDMLKSDVGCGITGYLIEDYGEPERFGKELLDYLHKEDISIGRGNHFLDFCQKCKSQPKNQKTVFLHSDFNPQGTLPKTFKQAQQRQKEASKQRQEYLEDLLTDLGISHEYMRDWPHNTVENGENVVYRKGSINTEEGIGIMATNPFHGLFLYAGSFDDYENSMQHSTGIKRDSRVDMDKYLLGQKDKKRVFLTKNKEPENIFEEYNPINEFAEIFSLEYSPIDALHTEIVVKTD